MPAPQLHHLLTAALLLPLLSQLSAQQFVQTMAQSMPGSPGRALLVDIDGDGDLDIVGAVSGSPTRLFLNNGDGDFTDASGTMPVTNDLSQTIAIADVDGDGDLDVFVGNAFQQNRLLIQTPGGFVDETAARLPVTADGTQASAFGDVDGDGDPDLVIGDQFASSILLQNNGAGVFTAAPLPQSFDNTRVVRFFDVDNDGDLDLFEGNDFGVDRLLVNDGLGTFTVVPSLSLSQAVLATSGAAVGDFDDDGRLDLLLTTGLAPNSLFRNTTVGNTVSFVDESFRLPALANNSATFGATFVDVDLDDDLDLALGTSFGQDQLWIQDSAGMFVDATDRLPQVPNATSSVMAGDVDGDGDPDLLFAGHSGGFLLNRLQHLETLSRLEQGQNWTLRASAAAGFAATSPAVAIFFAAPSAGDLPLGVFGTFRLDLATTFELGAVPLTALDGTGSLVIPVPAIPPVPGAEVNVQAFVVSPVAGLRLTNRIVQAVR